MLNFTDAIVGEFPESCGSRRRTDRIVDVDRKKNMFVQAPCVLPEGKARYVGYKGLYIACFTVFVYLFTISWIQY